MATPFDTRFDGSHYERDEQDRIARLNAAAGQPITANQVEFLTDLMTRKAALVGGDVAKIAPWVNSLSKTAASDRITEVKEWLAADAAITAEQQRVMGIDHDASSAESNKISGIHHGDGTVNHAKIATDAGMPGADVVPAGRYAIDTRLGAINETAFYRVDRPTEGRWAGRVFVKLITGGDEHRLSWRDTTIVLQRIADAGAQGASLRYGQEIGECGVCGRQLTNDESRAAGIGPVCRDKMAW